MRNETKRKIEADLKRLNKGNSLEPVSVEAYLAFAVTLVAPQHLDQLRLAISADRRTIPMADARAPIKWLTTSEAAHYLRVSISSLKTMIYRGQVRVHKLGRRNRFRLDDLDRTVTLSSFE